MPTCSPPFTHSFRIMYRPENSNIELARTQRVHRHSPPGPPYDPGFRQTAAYYGDQVFIASCRRTCEVWASQNLSAYCFNTKPAGIAWGAGVEHLSDVAFILNNLDGYGYHPSPFESMPESYTELSHLMAWSWASFATDLDPNVWSGRGRNATRAD
ncbi:uncharacterized protein BO97DRAFT_429389 [Aspergillus homomorphus CBS 101889]|uniref:Carboxylesterase type B domain-containing protein n=1 Tax=Aspergillus homomorphus (strain CBS 101889) TaxID=1450537 RepID=A0A395HHX9_ASPHC|nr:hypothetical protein BO97DRAFT_429389 [Aspergillus homomorphus CBS 101889]RAL07350.1 hypothetical protein BO97DRAFT_429389 [Aspergillus homomorphus CBS 101889]